VIVIESIHKSKIVETDPKVAQSILFGYIKLQPIYKNIIAGNKEKQSWGQDFLKV
jgi:DNA-directed RNA polymerase subunit E'/Rpb7